MLKTQAWCLSGWQDEGPWCKWKRAALTLDCVLMYAQRGSGELLVVLCGLHVWRIARQWRKFGARPGGEGRGGVHRQRNASTRPIDPHTYQGKVWTHPCPLKSSDKVLEDCVRRHPIIAAASIPGRDAFEHAFHRIRWINLTDEIAGKRHRLYHPAASITIAGLGRRVRHLVRYVRRDRLDVLARAHRAAALDRVSQNIGISAAASGQPDPDHRPLHAHASGGGQQPPRSYVATASRRLANSICVGRLRRSVPCCRRWGGQSRGVRHL